jgi:hypothetical protein
VLSEFSKLVFDGSSRVRAFGIGVEDLNAGLQGAVLARNLEEAAVLKISLSMNIVERDLAFPQG